jgi:hypothetical protein
VCLGLEQRTNLRVEGEAPPTLRPDFEFDLTGQIPVFGQAVIVPEIGDLLDRFCSRKVKGWWLAVRSLRS